MNAAPPPLNPTSQPAASRIGQRVWVLLSLILLLSLALRVYQIGHQNFWADEMYSVESAMGRGFAHRLLPAGVILDDVPDYFDPARAAPWWRIVPSCSADGAGDLHPPLPYLILRAWCATFGYSEVAARSLSVVLSCLGVLLLFGLARELFGNTTALWACLVMALAQPQIQLAQDAKHYAMLQAWSLAAAWALVRIERQPRGATTRRCVALGVAVLAMLFTHYFCALIVAAFGLYALIRLRSPDRRRTVSALLLAIGAFAALWGPSIVRQLHNQTGEAAFYNDYEPDFYARWFNWLSIAAFRTLAEPLPSAEWCAGLSMILLVLPALLARRRPDLLLVAIWIPMAILPLALMDLARHTWTIRVERYTFPAAAPVYLALCGLLSTARRPWLRHALPAVAALACLASIPYGAYLDRKQNHRRFAAYVTASVKPGELTVFYDPWNYRDAYIDFITTSYYVRRGGRAFPGPVLLLREPATPALEAQIRQRFGDHFWFIDRVPAAEAAVPGAKAGLTQYVNLVAYLQEVTLPPAAPAATSQVSR